MRVLACLTAMCLLSACIAKLPEVEGPPEPSLPATRWDHRPEAPVWTEATLEALKDHGTPLLSTVPADIDYYCPGYATATEEERAAFWVGLFSALAYHESTWNPTAVGAVACGTGWCRSTRAVPSGSAAMPRPATR